MKHKKVLSLLPALLLAGSLAPRPALPPPPKRTAPLWPLRPGKPLPKRRLRRKAKWLSLPPPP